MIMMIAIAILAPSLGIEFIYSTIEIPADGLFAIISIFLCIEFSSACRDRSF